ncbi:MAG: hypothetical protein ACK4GN_08240 [Runella sp.]
MEKPALKFSRIVLFTVVAILLMVVGYVLGNLLKSYLEKIIAPKMPSDLADKNQKVGPSVELIEENIAALEIENSSEDDESKNELSLVDKIPEAEAEPPQIPSKILPKKGKK